MSRTCNIKKCATPWCKDQVSVVKGNTNKKKLYCEKCRDEHEISVLLLQTEYNKEIKEIIIEQAILFNFKSIRLLADALVTQISYVRYWIEKYFDLDWDEFRIVYRCKNAKCEKIAMKGIKNKYYIVKQLKDKRICSCLTKDNSILVKVKDSEHEQVLDKILNK